MLIRRAPDVRSSDITQEHLYWNRREWIAAAGTAFAAGAVALGPRSLSALAQGKGPEAIGTPYGLQKDDKPTPWEDITGYNNFYEFGTGKEDPAEYAKGFKPKPWTVKVDGMVKHAADYQLEDFIKPSKLEDRIYRHRCVEAWSMVIPWRGFSLADVLKRAEPTPQAKFVEF